MNIRSTERQRGCGQVHVHDARALLWNAALDAGGPLPVGHLPRAGLERVRWVAWRRAAAGHGSYRRIQQPDADPAPIVICSECHKSFVGTARVPGEHAV
eukprot:4388762-Prymnesium_polylepis.1